jgi:hypothetical protein
MITTTASRIEPSCLISTGPRSAVCHKPPKISRATARSSAGQTARPTPDSRRSRRRMTAPSAPPTAPGASLPASPAVDRVPWHPQAAEPVTEPQPPAPAGLLFPQLLAIPEVVFLLLAAGLLALNIWIAHPQSGTHRSQRCHPPERRPPRCCRPPHLRRRQRLPGPCSRPFRARSAHSSRHAARRRRRHRPHRGWPLPLRALDRRSPRPSHPHRGGRRRRLPPTPPADPGAMCAAIPSIRQAG